MGDQYSSPQRGHLREVPSTWVSHLGQRWTLGGPRTVRSPQTSQRPLSSSIMAPQVGHERMGPSQWGHERASWGICRSQWGQPIRLFWGDFCPRQASTQAITTATASIAAPM